MNYKVLITSRFEKELKKLSKKFPSLKMEFSQLVSTVSNQPEFGTFMGNNSYKIRLAISSKEKGKRGEGRVITYIYHSDNTVYLLSIYDKSEKEDLKDSELKELISQLDLEA